MPSPLPQDTPFAELRHAVQAGANEITWQKRTPISNNERNHAMRLKKTVCLYAAHTAATYHSCLLYPPHVIF